MPCAYYLHIASIWSCLPYDPIYQLLQVLTQTSVAGSSEVGRYGKGNRTVAGGKVENRTGKGWGSAAMLVCRTFYMLGHLIIKTFCGYYFVKLSISLFDGVNGKK